MEYSSPPGRHRHQCPDCGAIWEHEDVCSELPFREKILAHSCPQYPKCRGLASKPYTGAEPPTKTGDAKCSG